VCVCVCVCVELCAELCAGRVDVCMQSRVVGMYV